MESHIGIVAFLARNVSFLAIPQKLQIFAANIANKELLKCDPPVIVSANTSDDSSQHCHSTTLVLLHLCILVISSKKSKDPICFPSFICVFILFSFCCQQLSTQLHCLEVCQPKASS